MSTRSLRRFVAESPVQRALIVREVSAFAAELEDGCRVLDAGAGEAPYRQLFAHCDYLTQDWSASVHPGARSADVVGDLADLPLAAGSFDAVVLTEVLEHVAAPADVVRELVRVLRPGGRVLVTVPFVGQLHEEPHDHYRYTSHGLTGLFERGGFAGVRVRPLGGWFTTMAHVLRHQGLSTAAPGRPVPNRLRAVGALSLAASMILARAAGALDRRLDRRRAFPLGWALRAALPSDPRGPGHE